MRSMQKRASEKPSTSIPLRVRMENRSGSNRRFLDTTSLQIGPLLRQSIPLSAAKSVAIKFSMCENYGMSSLISEENCAHRHSVSGSF